MKRKLLAIALGGAFALPAFANYELYGNGVAPQAPLSTKGRAEVRDELVAAQRSGQFIANAETGQKANQLHPQSYPAVLVAGKARAEVLAELADAQRRGDVIVNAELGLKANQVFPQHYGQAVVASR
jgi:hypothetical protein